MDVTGTFYKGQKKSDPDRLEPHSMDFSMIVIILFLCILGSMVLFSSSYYRAQNISQDYMFFLRKRMMYLMLGIPICFGVALIPIEYIKKVVPTILISSFFLLMLTFIPGLGITQNGGRRWIDVFGFSFQPSELVKISMILYLAYVLEKKKLRDESRDLGSVINVILITALFIFLIYLQNDLSTSFFVGFVSFSMLIICGVRKRLFFSVMIFVGIFLVATLTLVPFRVERLKTFLDPYNDPSGAGFQIINSLKALQNGGMFGVGIGMGSQKLGNIPEVYSDFIFTVVAEEMGYIGVCLVLGTFALLTYKGLYVCYYSQSYFNAFASFGLATSIILQVFMNVCVVAGIIPTTGVTLPFFSSGGSSLLITLIMCGLLLNLSRYTFVKK